MPKKEYFERERLYELGYWHGATPTLDNPCPDGVDAVDTKDIDSIPAADVRPVVYCRDCKYAPIGYKDGSDLEWPFNEFDDNPCPHKCLDNWYSHKPAPDFFCAAGEKREES